MSFVAQTYSVGEILAASKLNQLVSNLNEIRQTFDNGKQLAPFKNLLITRASASTLSVSADQVLLHDTNNNHLLVETVSETLNIASSGANGLDTGVEASSINYYIWVISNASGSTVDTLISTARTISSLTLPSGYEFAGLVGWIYNDSSSDFISGYVQYNNLYVITNVSILSSGAATSETSVSLALVAPFHFDCLAHLVVQHSPAAAGGFVSLRAFTGQAVWQKLMRSPGAALVGGEITMFSPRNTSTMYYFNDAASGSSFISGVGGLIL